MIENTKARIIYVPGYGGNNERSTTFQAIKKELGAKHEVTCLTYNNHDPDEARSQLETQLEKHFKENSEIVLVGTSLGGYWANYLCEKYDFPTVLVNPSHDPSKNLKNRGVPQEICDKFKLPVFSKNKDKTIILGGKDDVVDPYVTLELVKSLYPVQFYVKEGHRFEDKSPIIHTIIEKINNATNYITVD